MTKRPRPGRERIAVITRTRAERDELRAASEREGVSLSAYVLEAALAQARGGGLLLPASAAEVIRAQAAARGIPADRLAALIATAAVGWPSP